MAGRSLSRVWRAREKLLWVVALASAYAALSFLWSTMGFASPVAPVHFGEYSSAQIVTEIGGHVLFGVAAALPTMDGWLVLLAGGESVLIDADHILAALGYPVAGRLAHSVFFALAAAALLGYLSYRARMGGKGVFFVTLSAVAAHFSYDVFAGNGVFYILSPLSLAAYAFSYPTWPVFMAAAVGLNVVPKVWHLRVNSRNN